MPSSKHPYGSAEYYAEYFADVLGDANDDPEIAFQLLKGFRLAIDDWLAWHVKCSQNYDQMLQHFLKNDV